MRLINADAMRQDWLENGENEYVYDANAVLDSIDAQPTVDAVEVVHGRCWLCEDYDRLVEMVCYLPNNIGGAATIPINYCPNCGAKLGGDAT